MRNEESSAHPVDRLLRGLRTARVAMSWNAARELRALGPDWVPSLRAKLRGTDLGAGATARGDKSLGILLALLDELDHEAFESEIGRLQRRALHPHHARMVALLAKRLASDTAPRVGRDVPVRVATELGDPAPIVKTLTPWVRRVGRDFDTIAWIDIASRFGHDDLSRYNPLFSGIVLTWPDPDLAAAEQKTALMQPEFMFYRAVGHHARNRTKGGSFDDREKAADSYATRAFRRAHPLYARKFGRKDQQPEWSR